MLSISVYMFRSENSTWITYKEHRLKNKKIPSHILCIKHMDSDSFQADRGVLRKLYRLLQISESGENSAISEILDNQSRSFLKKLLDDAAKRMLEAHVKIMVDNWRSEIGTNSLGLEEVKVPESLRSVTSSMRRFTSELQSRRKQRCITSEQSTKLEEANKSLACSTNRTTPKKEVEDKASEVKELSNKVDSAMASIELLINRLVKPIQASSGQIGGVGTSGDIQKIMDTSIDTKAYQDESETSWSIVSSPSSESSWSTIEESASSDITQTYTSDFESSRSSLDYETTRTRPTSSQNSSEYDASSSSQSRSRPRKGGKLTRLKNMVGLIFQNRHHHPHNKSEKGKQIGKRRFRDTGKNAKAKIPSNTSRDQIQLAKHGRKQKDLPKHEGMNKKGKKGKQIGHFGTLAKGIFRHVKRPNMSKLYGKGGKKTNLRLNRIKITKKPRFVLNGRPKKSKLTALKAS